MTMSTQKGHIDHLNQMKGTSSLIIYASVPVKLGDLPDNVLIQNEVTVVNLFS